jgi:hypothetical protein
MSPILRTLRPLLVGALAIALVAGVGGCRWFKHKSDYSASKEDRPLEVPPDLDHPDTSTATSLPAMASSTVTAPSTLSNADVMVAGGSASELYPKIGAALEGIAGVTINGRAEALSSYDVSYQGQSFLIRAQDSQGGSRLMALSADGRLLNAGPGAELLKLVRAKL